MALFMVKTWMGNKNPDDYFDPVTHIATEENFIKFLECGVYDSKYIGYKVQLSNTAAYNNGLWMIAGVSHDSANTGQSNCYDLISVDGFNAQVFGSSYNWRSSTIRTWLNSTFYNGLSALIQAHALSIKYNSQGTWYDDDKVIIPSFTEINGATGTSSTAYDVEGVAYSIFTDNASRVKHPAGSSGDAWWWTRSRYKSGTRSVWAVGNTGTLYYNNYNNAGCVVLPVLRVR